MQATHGRSGQAHALDVATCGHGQSGHPRITGVVDENLLQDVGVVAGVVAGGSERECGAGVVGAERRAVVDRREQQAAILQLHVPAVRSRDLLQGRRRRVAAVAHGDIVEQQRAVVGVVALVGGAKGDGDRIAADYRARNGHAGLLPLADPVTKQGVGDRGRPGDRPVQNSAAEAGHVRIGRKTGSVVLARTPGEDARRRRAHCGLHIEQVVVLSGLVLFAGWKVPVEDEQGGAGGRGERDSLLQGGQVVVVGGVAIDVVDGVRDTAGTS